MQPDFVEAMQTRHLRQKSYELLEDIAFYALMEHKRLLVEALEREAKAGYKPSQPRVPAGHPDGGQWVGIGGGGTSRTPYQQFAQGDSVPPTWSRPETYIEHFENHGGDFNATSPEDYANQANDFFKRAQQEKLPTVIDKDGNIRIYDPKSNTFGSYNPDGTTRTFYKPNDGEQYFKDQIEKDLKRGGKIIHPLDDDEGNDDDQNDDDNQNGQDAEGQQEQEGEGNNGGGGGGLFLIPMFPGQNIDDPYSPHYN